MYRTRHSPSSRAADKEGVRVFTLRTSEAGDSFEPARATTEYSYWVAGVKPESLKVNVVQSVVPISIENRNTANSSAFLVDGFSGSQVRTTDWVVVLDASSPAGAVGAAVSAAVGSFPLREITTAPANARSTTAAMTTTMPFQFRERSDAAGVSANCFRYRSSSCSRHTEHPWIVPLSSVP
jgi:hypothetical protein